MAKKVCCCRIATCVIIAAWVKIIFHVVYIILLTMNLLHLVGIWGPGNLNLKVAIQENPSKYPDYYRVLEYAYEYLLFYLLCLLGYNILGIPLNIVLLKGALQRNERKLKIWLYFTIINIITMFPYVMWRLISIESIRTSIPNSAIKLAVNYLIESFCLWRVFALFQEIRQEQENPLYREHTFSPSLTMINEAEIDVVEIRRSPPETPPPIKDICSNYNLR